MEFPVLVLYDKNLDSLGRHIPEKSLKYSRLLVVFSTALFPFPGPQ